MASQGRRVLQRPIEVGDVALDDRTMVRRIDYAKAPALVLCQFECG